MFVVVTLYGSWTPTLSSVQHILFTISGQSRVEPRSQDSQNLNYFSGVCFFFNSTLNPILYSVMSLRFRRGFRDMRRNVLQKMFNSSSHQSEGSGSKYSPRQRKRFASLNLCPVAIFVVIQTLDTKRSEAADPVEVRITLYWYIYTLIWNNERELCCWEKNINSNINTALWCCDLNICED